MTRVQLVNGLIGLVMGMVIAIMIAYELDMADTSALLTGILGGGGGMSFGVFVASESQ